MTVSSEDSSANEFVISSINNPFFNAGALATTEHGTVLGVIYSGVEMGKKFLLLPMRQDHF